MTERPARGKFGVFAVSRLACAALLLAPLAAACGRPAAPPASRASARPDGAVAPTAAVAPRGTAVAAAAVAVPGRAVAVPGTTPPTTAAPAAPAAPAVPLTGPELYTKYCTLCHGPGAEGYAADNAPSLVSRTFAATASDDFLRTAIERGRPGTAMGGYGALVGGPLARPEVDRLVAHLRSLAPVPEVALGVQPVHGSAKRGEAVYQKDCVACHGTRTQRATAVHLFNPVLLVTASDAFLRHAIFNGRPGTRMEAWKGKLPDRAIDDVVAYLRSVAPSSLVAALAMPAMGTSSGMEAARPLKGPLVINPRGKQAQLTLKDDRLVSLEQVRAALDGKRRIIIVDARTPSEWLRLHITGSISIPYYDMKGIEKLPNDGTWIVAYCACPHHASGVVYEELRRRGYKHSAVLDEGVYAWQQKGHPVVAAPGTLPVPAPPTTGTTTPSPPAATGTTPPAPGPVAAKPAKPSQ